jgi:hypothetical protein
MTSIMPNAANLTQAARLEMMNDFGELSRAAK